MKLEKIIAISGRPGLYEVITQSRTSIIAVSLTDGKRISSSIHNQLSMLSEIQIYSLYGEVPLIEVFEKILTFENGQKARVKPKAAASDLEAYFFEVFSDYDEERVYPSDIKKIIQWYNILLDKKILTLPQAAETEAEEAVKSEVASETVTDTASEAASETESSEENPTVE